MKKSPYILLLFFCTLLVTSCKKKDLPPEDGTTDAPVFYIKGNVNNFPVNLQAGMNNYFMTSSYYQESTGVYVYKADMKQKDCSGSISCGYAVSILINDAEVSAPGAAINVSGGLKAGVYQFSSNDPAIIGYTAKFTPTGPFVADGEYSWDFGDGSALQSSYETTHTFNTTKKCAVKFNLAVAGSDVSLSNVFNMGNPLQTTVKVTRDLQSQESLIYQFSAIPTGQGPYQYSWDFGDGMPVSTDASPVHSYKLPGYYTAKLLLIDQQKDTCVSYYQVPAYFDLHPNTNYTALFTPVKDTKFLSDVTVLVTDTKGAVYSSKDHVQPAGSSFEVVSVEDYKPNELGQPTKKIKIKFSCTVNSGSDQIVIQNGEAVIAVAYK